MLQVGPRLRGSSQKASSVQLLLLANAGVQSHLVVVKRPINSFSRLEAPSSDYPGEDPDRFSCLHTGTAAANKRLVLARVRSGRVSGWLDRAALERLRYGAVVG